MENTKTIILYNITPVELKDMIIADLKIELEVFLHRRFIVSFVDLDFNNFS